MNLISEINEAVKRAAEMGYYEADRRIQALESMKDQYQKKGTLSTAQEHYLKSLLRKFSAEECNKFKQWCNDWKNDEHVRERGNIISKYYMAQGSYFLTVARVVQDNLKGLTEQVPDFHQFHRMTLNEYAEKVWKSHIAPLVWKEGDLVSVRASAKIHGYTYQLKQHGIDVSNNPCLVLEVGSGVIQNAVKYDEKRGGARWVSINPIGTTHIFQVMEKDLKKYRQPKRSRK